MTSVREWMTQHPISVESDTMLFTAYGIMREQGIRHLPILDRRTGKLLTVISRTQVRHRQFETLLRYAGSGLGSLAEQTTTFEMVDLPPLVTISADATMREAAHLLVKYNLTALPVVDDGNLIGILTESDIYRLYAQLRQR
jgi:CBS domain-containing protein